MTELVAVLGTSVHVGRPSAEPIDAVVQATVRAALRDAGIESLDEIDTLVTVGSDFLDGAMVATHSGIAGSYGHSLMTVPSSAGHALAAAVVMIESGSARNVLLVGWGEGSKFAEVDGRIAQADPFYARPLGAGAAELAALQAQRLLAIGRLQLSDANTYCETMLHRAGDEAGLDPPGSVPQWLATRWADGACALILGPATFDGGTSVTVRDFGSSFQPYCPEPAALDPAGWIAAAQQAMRVPSSYDDDNLILLEAGGPTALCEALALSDLLATQRWAITDARVNPSGGGAAAFFGPATGLRRLAEATKALRRETSGNERSSALVLDLAGPIGQATTVILLESSPA